MLIRWLLSRYHHRACQPPEITNHCSKRRHGASKTIRRNSWPQRATWTSRPPKSKHTNTATSICPYPRRALKANWLRTLPPITSTHSNRSTRMISRWAARATSSPSNHIWLHRRAARKREDMTIRRTRWMDRIKSALLRMKRWKRRSCRIRVPPPNQSSSSSTTCRSTITSRTTRMMNYAWRARLGRILRKN